MIGCASLISSVAGVAWPAIPDERAARLLSVVMQLEESQWWTPEALKSKQFDQFALLAGHTYRNSPFFRKRFDEAGLNSPSIWTSGNFAKIPLLTRRDLMLQADQIRCNAIPHQHGKIHKIKTSGSTGEVVTVLRTGVSQLMWLALSMREHLWHKRDYSLSLAVIKALINAIDDPQEAKRIGWGWPTTLLFKTGTSYAQPISLDIKLQAEWLARVNPHYLLTYPSNLEALLDYFESGGVFPHSLKQVRTVGETLHSGLRERCRLFGKIDIVDMYSSQEVGLIALQCPVSGLYHTQDESLIVEVLNDAGNPCKPGEVGKIVITDLHNFATPIIRYEIRDYAEMGPSCPCGRGLNTFSRIMGRRRNMVALPNGEQHWPLVGVSHLREIADIQQYQIVQRTLNDVDVVLRVPQSISAEQETKLASLIRTSLGYPFQLRFVYTNQELPKTRGGKFEEFISMVAATTTTH